MRICLANCGYGGWGRLIAFAISTPCDTFCVVGGFTGTGTGGVVVSSTLTTGPVPLQVTQPGVSEPVRGGSTFRSPRWNEPLTGGTSNALVPTLSGTLVGSLV